ncbi:SAM-dependent methyltransferase [Amycolatopsis sp. FDAARGOS 1241]|uniref:SAM-dependent methyltransferase n=1 Tax=Amycolatopsis sp. FDAARGOS 1241 TaxID=2778070 RepID=UPI001EF28444|nr:SAM-dependent methyltransferase [Amycolatopsis sp. FDAARGOS 1241]
MVSGTSTRFDQPNLARVSDALLGGCDHYEADRAAVRRLLDIAPGAETMAREHRAWLVRVVRFLAAERGVDQFLDLGSGLPAAENTHQVAQRHNPDARVVYVDNDPVVQVHGRAVLEENDRTHVSGADLTDPGATLGDPIVYRHLDFDRPMALLLCGVLHHVDVLDRAQHIARTFAAELCPGSYLVLTHHHAPTDDPPRQALAQLLDSTFEGTALATVHRSRAEIASFFTGLNLLDPGLGYLHDWWPDGPRLTPLDDLNFLTLGGVALKT